MRRQVKVYTPLLKYERLLYAIQDVRLPRPVTYSQLGFYFGALGAVWAISKFPGMGGFIKDNWIPAFGLFPIFFSVFMTKFKLDGKPPHIYLRDFIQYTLSSGVYNRYEKTEKPAKYKYATVVTFRRRDVAK